MKYSTERKKRLRLQGHRKRRRVFEVKKTVESGIRWTEYKTLRQYPAVGSMLEEFRTYGYRAGVQNLVDKDNTSTGYGHDWLTEEHDTVRSMPEGVRTRR